MDWDDDKVLALDGEMSGVAPEYGLQPWRVRQDKAWITSLVAVKKVGDAFRITGDLTTPYERPNRDMIVKMAREILTEAADTKTYITGWSTVFDISWLLAYGLEKEVFACKWLDGMLLWRHYFLEPEYDKDRSKKRSYGLKGCVAEVLPQFAGYEEDIDFHDPDPAVRAKLHEYNIRDSLFTLKLTKHWWEKLVESDPRRLRAALIEAECLPMLAQANLNGMLVDVLKANELSAQMTRQALKALEALAPFGVRAKLAGDSADTVNSPKQMAQLLFEDWGLPIYKRNKLTPKQREKGMTEGAPSTDRETLFELSHEDPRAKQLLSLREALNLRTKFAISTVVSAEYNEDGHTHPSAIPFGTYSGRLTYGSRQSNKAKRPEELEDDDE